MIELDKIMLPKHKALSSVWGDEKQEQWGKLTAIAITFTRDKLKQGEFKTIEEVFDYLSEFRKVIGVLLEHSADVGVRRRLDATTPINDKPKTGLRDMLPEFESMINEIKESPELLQLVNTQGGLILNGQLSIQNVDRVIHYPRSSIIGENKNFRIKHSNPKSIAFMFQNAEKQFKKLSEHSELDEEAKSKLIKKIFYHLADAMPCERGSSSIMQMLFYALEGAYLGKMHYLGKMASKHGHEQGISPDLAAMISPTFDYFSDYFDEFIVQENIEVMEPKHDSHQVFQDALDSSLYKELHFIKQELNRYYPFKAAQIRGGRGIRPKQGKTKLWGSEILFLESLIKESSNEPNKLKQIETMMVQLKKMICRRNPFRYAMFYERMQDKRSWPEPTVPDNLPLSENSDVYFEDVQVILNSLASYGAGCIGLQDQGKKGSHYYVGPGSVGQIYRLTDLSKDVLLFLADSVDVLEEDISSNSKFMDEFADTLHTMVTDSEKGISKEVTIQCLIEKINLNINELYGINKVADRFFNNNIDKLNKSLSQLYDNRAKIIENLKELHPLCTSLELKSVNAKTYILGEESLSMDDNFMQKVKVLPEGESFFSDLVQRLHSFDNTLSADEKLEQALMGMDVGKAIIVALRLNKKDLAMAIFKQAQDSNKENMNLDIQDAFGFTPLMWAIRKNHIPLLEAMLNADAQLDLNATDQFGHTAIVLAMQLGRIDMVQQCLNASSSPDLSIAGYVGSALSYAQRSSCSRDIAALIIARMPKEHLDKSLFTFAQRGQLDLCQLCIEAGANVHTQSKGNTVLMSAVQSGNARVVQYFVDAGVELNAKDNHGATALQQALTRNRRDSTIALIEAGALMNFDEIKSNKSMFEFVFEMDADSHQTINQPSVLEALLKSNHFDKDKALLFACAMGAPFAVECLIAHGADINYTNANGSSCLMITTDEDVMCMLIKAGAKVNHQNKAGTTALMFAAEDGSEEILKLLLDRGAQITLSNKAGKTALDFAQENQQTSCVELMQSHQLHMQEKEKIKKKTVRKI